MRTIGKMENVIKKPEIGVRKVGKPHEREEVRDIESRIPGGTPRLSTTHKMYKMFWMEMGWGAINIYIKRKGNSRPRENLKKTKKR